MAGTPTLAFLQPTKYEFNENVRHAQLHAAVWQNVLQPDTSGMDPTSFRWSLEDGYSTLFPTTLPRMTVVVSKKEEDIHFRQVTIPTMNIYT